jgi:hypothetical protein
MENNNSNNEQETETNEVSEYQKRIKFVQEMLEKDKIRMNEYYNQHPLEDSPKET